MREGAPDQLLAGWVAWEPRVQSWRGGELLSAAVPVRTGTFFEDESSDVPDRIDLSVPRYVDGFDWLPGSQWDHPLASNGQYLVASIVVRSLVTGAEWVTPLGHFDIQDFNEDEPGLVKVATSGILQRFVDNGLTTPHAPRTGGTFISELRRLVPPGIPVEVSDDIVDRAVPASVEFSDERLESIYKLRDALPARILVDGYGQLQVLPDLPEVPAPVLTVRDGPMGTLIHKPTHGTRDGIYNRVIVRAADTDGIGQNPVLAVVDKTTGPYAADLEGFGIKTSRFSSPFVTTTAQALSAGAKRLNDGLRPARVVRVEMVPDPRIQLGDPLELIKDGVRDVGYVIAVQHPLTVDDGSSLIDVGIA